MDKELLYIYKKKYYSAIKRKASELVLMRWRNLEPIIQNEVSQKEKNKYILTVAWHRNNCEEIPHLQWQRSPSKMVGTGAVAAWCWNKGEAKRRSPDKMARGAKSRLESNSIPTRDALRAQTNLVHTRTQKPHRD